MKKVTVTVESKSGLHARPASTFVALAQKFQSEVILEKEDSSINAKSIIGILSLGVSQNDVITIIADGDDEVEAVDALVKLVQEELIHQ